jgi:hypothetical protein
MIVSAQRTIAHAPTIDRRVDEHASVYRAALLALTRERVPFLVGGGYALERYTGVRRGSRDLDLFVREVDLPRALMVLERSGFSTEVTFSHWLAKAHASGCYIDIIFSSGNGIAQVDDSWFVHARDGAVLGVPVKLCPAEEMIWSKAFVMERERHDGADVAHLLRALGPRLDWHRLLARFGDMWRLLLSHLTLFGFIYPGDRERLPRWVMRELLSRLDAELNETPSPDRLCQGTLLSRGQYLPDIEDWGYEDARLRPHGSMTEQQTAAWTAAIEGEPERNVSSQGPGTPRRGR